MHYNEWFQQIYSKLGYKGDYYHNYIIPIMIHNNIELVEAADYVDRKINIQYYENNKKKLEDLKLLFKIRVE